MLTLTTTLHAHQRNQRRKPHLLASSSPTHFGVPILRFQFHSSDSEPDCPIATALYQGYYPSARNNAGSLQVRAPDFSAPWSTLDTISAGQGFALAFDPAAALFHLLYADGNDLKLRTSTTGASWSASSTLLTEASPIGAVALAFDPNGDACAFFNLGASTTLKRLRRTSGSWPGAATTWSPSFSGSISGIAASWDSDYHLIITGAATQNRVWAITMGDTLLPPNAWSSFRNIAEADLASTVTFAHPHIAQAGTVIFATFQQTESGNVPYSRTLLTSTTETAGHLGYWREPVPLPLTTASGAALAFDPADDVRPAWLVGPQSIHYALTAGTADLSSRVLRCTWHHTPTTARLRLELDNTDGLALLSGDLPVRLGDDLTLKPGFLSAADGSPEYGLTIRLPITRIASNFAPGASTITLECDGPWEHLARFRHTHAWTAPASTARQTIFAQLAARAGIEVSAAASPIAPSAAWSDTPAFAVVPNETAAQALHRLLLPTPDFLRTAAAGAFEILDPSAATTPTEDYAFQPPALAGDAHQALASTTLATLETNWLRVHGPDRYADAITSIDDQLAGALTNGPQLEILRDLYATDNTKAQAAADRALARLRLIHPIAEATVHFNAAQELFDPVRLYGGPGIAPDASTDYRVIGLALEYRRQPGATPAFNSILTLGRL